MFISVWEAMEEKCLKTLAISTGFVIVLSFVFKFFGIPDGLGLILSIDFIPFQVFLMLFQIISK